MFVGAVEHAWTMRIDPQREHHCSLASFDRRLRHCRLFPIPIRKSSNSLIDEGRLASRSLRIARIA